MAAETEPRFVVDVMLGRLARWLRLLGYDAAYGNDWDDAYIARLALREERTILTRDRELLARRSVRVGVLVNADDLRTQLGIVRDACGIELRTSRLFGRCPVCNVELAEADAEQARGHVPPIVLRRHDGFRRCPSCERFYWAGSHAQLARRHLAGLF